MRVSIIPRIVKKLRQLIGIVQDTDTATRNIEKGKYVIWKGSLCKATTAITTGDTLSGSNLEAVADGGFNELNSKSFVHNPSVLIKRVDYKGITYTAPDDCFVLINARDTTSGYKIGILVDSVEIMQWYSTEHCCLLLPLKKGSVLSNTSQDNNIRDFFITVFKST